MSTGETPPGNEHNILPVSGQDVSPSGSAITIAEEGTQPQAVLLPDAETAILTARDHVRAGAHEAVPQAPDAQESTQLVKQPKQAVSDYKRGDLLGRYVVLELLGRGGMGAVYTAYDPKLDRRVAVKLLRTTRKNPQKRLVREAKALAKLSHPNVVQVHDAGVHQGNVFIAMELVPGVSLREWVQSEPRPTWQEVLATYLDAARGLAAAHQNGLVHRDVKPSNLLRGTDGRVRVADFGLAAAQHSAQDTSGDSKEESDRHEDSVQSNLSGSLDERLTATGSIIGTPAYMAPEQHLSADVGPAADQYSLCASLYEALYGKLPFAVESGRGFAGKLLGKKLRTEVLPPPPGSPVPAWVFQALRRGLSATPADRYLSMGELIAALSDDPGARRRSRMHMAALGCMTLLLATLALWGWARSGVFDDSCNPEEQRRFLAGSWDNAVQARIQTAFLATGKAYAIDTAKRVSAVLEAYAGAWVAMRAEVCRAHGQADSEAERELLKLRTLCLERRRGQLQALAEVLGAAADDTVLDKAVFAAQGLYPLSYCADGRALTARLPPPEDPALRAKVEALQPRVDRLEALYEAGKYQEGLEEAERLRTEVAGLGHVPLRAEAMFWLARMQIHAGNYDSARVHVQEAMYLASQAADDILAAKAWGLLLYTVGDGQKRLEELKLFVDGVSAVVDDTRDDRARAFLLNYLAIALGRLGKFEDARVTHERALALRDKALGPDHPDVALSLNNLANILKELGKYDQAKAMHERALALRENALGHEHPEVALSLNNLANVLAQMGKYEEARATYERSMAATKKALGPEHPEVASALNNLAAVLNEMGKYQEAKVQYEQALAMKEKALGPEHPDVAFSLNNLALVLDHMLELEQAKAMYERALAILEKAFGPEHPDVALLLNNLANTLSGMGNYEEARVNYERALAIRQKIYGPEHPNIAQTLSNLALLFKHIGKYEEAKVAQERAVAIIEKVLGPEHPRVGILLTNLGRMLHGTGNYKEARATCERALAVLEKALGHDHPDIGITMYSLARLLRDTGEQEAAKAMHERVLRIWEKALGPEHPDLMFPLIGMGRMLIAGDRQSSSMELAERHLERAKAIGDKGLEPQSPEWAEMFLSLGELALARQQPQEAVAVLERALAMNNLEYQADIQLALAEALWRAAGRDTRNRDSRREVRARAVDLARQARDRCREIGHQPKLARAERWLAEHPLP